MLILICYKCYVNTYVISVISESHLYDIDHLFKFLFGNCTLSLVRYLLKFLAYFWIRSLFSYCWVLGLIYKFWITVLYQMYLLQIFSPSLWLIFLLTWHFLPSVKVSNFMRSNNINYFFHRLYLWCFIEKVITLHKII